MLLDSNFPASPMIRLFSSVSSRAGLANVSIHSSISYLGSKGMHLGAHCLLVRHANQVSRFPGQNRPKIPIYQSVMITIATATIGKASMKVLPVTCQPANFVMRGWDISSELYQTWQHWLKAHSPLTPLCNNKRLLL